MNSPTWFTNHREAQQVLPKMSDEELYQAGEDFDAFFKASMIPPHKALPDTGLFGKQDQLFEVSSCLRSVMCGRFQWIMQQRLKQ